MNPFELVANSVRSTVRTPVWVYAHPSMEHLAQSIVETCLAGVPDTPSSSQAQDLNNWFMRERIKRRPEFRKTIKWGSFRDGFPDLFIEDVKEMAGKDVIFLASFHSPAVIFEQLSVIYAIPRYLAKSFTLILPYFATGTMERVDTEGQIATAKDESFEFCSRSKTLAQLLSNIPLTSRGPAQVMVFDIHVLQERFYFTENVIPRLETAIPLLKQLLPALEAQERLNIAFPDDGAHKRFHSMFTDFQHAIVCHKIRNGAKRIVKVKDGDPSGHHVVIVDDLVQTGGTLIECAKIIVKRLSKGFLKIDDSSLSTDVVLAYALLERGATKVSAYVTHAVFPQDSWKRFTDSEVNEVKVKFENFWITDSIPHAREIAQHPPFKLLSLSRVIADALLGFDLKQV